MIKISYVILSFILLVSSFSVSAGKIYRFKDQNNLSTLSKVLPPYAAQKGYDILNDKTLTLIKHMESREQIEEARDKRQQERHQKQAEQKKKQEENKLLSEKRLRDQTLLDRYPSEEVLIKSHASEILYIQNKIDRMKSQQAREIQTLIKLQSQAADEEINDGEVSANLQTRMSLSQQNIDANRLILNKLIEEREVTSEHYNSDLEYLRKLLN